MDEDKHDKAGISPNGDPAKRPPPTIELTASDVSDRQSASDSPESGTAETETRAPPPDQPDAAAASPPKSSRTASVLVSALAGAAAAALVLGVAKFAGWPGTPPPVASIPSAASKDDVSALGTRIAKIESEAARPVADPAMAARLDALDKSIASLRGDVAAARAQSENTAAALGELKSASPQAVPVQPSAGVDTSAIEERLGKIERATAALSEAAATPAPPPQPPAETMNMRRLDALIDLEKAMRHGAPYVTALAAARSVVGDADVLKPLDPFAATGIPSADALSRELLALLPQLAPKPEALPAPSGIVDRLQQSFAKLVRVQRTDTLGSGAAGIIARATAAAQRSDPNEAKRELVQLPPSDRIPARPWIAKVEGRDKALAAAEQFTMDTLTAISKSAR